MFKMRKANDRGHADHGWLKSYHTFSFADYFDAHHHNFGPLRVINEDFIAAGQGFPMHGHKQMEIITYVLSGALSHKDSLGNNSVISPGDVQKMSAGPGIMHSEFNPLKDQETHLFQIWIQPNTEVPTSYQQINFAKKFAAQNLTLVCDKVGQDDSIKIAQDAKLFVGKIKNNEKIDYKIDTGRSLWVQNISGTTLIGDMILNDSDAVAITEENKITLSTSTTSHFLLFDLNF